MHNSNYKLEKLKDRVDLLQKSINLLNEEWPRSQAAREHSQRRSLRSTPPMAFVFIDTSVDRLIGHARICLLPNRTDSCWVESVIITKEERGKGLGKILMHMLEEECKKLGFNKAYLSTEDKIEFYRRCGYTECSVILHSTATTSVFPICSHIETDLSSKVLATSVISKAVPPAPPPPPSPQFKSIQTNGISTIQHQYMMKVL